MSLLVWLSYKAQSNEQLARQQQYHNLIQSQLKLVDEKMSHYFQQLERTLLADKALFELTSAMKLTTIADKIRKFLTSSPYVSHLYIEDQQKNILYPSLSLVLSTEEQDFLVKINTLAIDKTVFQMNHGLDNDHLTTNQENSSTSGFSLLSRSIVSQKISQNEYARSVSDQSAIEEKGWISWYQDRYLQHFFWFKDRQQRLYIFSLDRIRIISELIALLPNHLTPEFKKSKVQLLNANNELLYQWSTALLETRVETQDFAKIERILSYPLNSWKLTWLTKNPSLSAVLLQQGSWLIWVIIALLLIAIIAWIVYRGYYQEMQQAQQRVNFVGQVSHELKTPLTNIRMYTELLMMKIDALDDDCTLASDNLNSDEKQNKNKVQHFLQVILNESLRLSRLIENVLNFSNVQKQSFKINKTNNNVDQCIDQVLLSFMPIFKQKNIKVYFSNNAPQSMCFDSQLLEQILNNLLSNVDKYAAQGKRLDIISQQVTDTIIIECRDYGQGIDSNEQQKIFNAFYRSHSKLTEGVSGTGIGLTISQQLAVLHGGSLSYKIRDKGACFVIKLATNNTHII
jgi:signal transduction histidine kinase